MSGKHSRNVLEMISLTPNQVYVDAYGYVQIFPGIALGNAWQILLHVIIEEFDPDRHPGLESLINAGVVGLIQASGFQPNIEYIEPYHCCYSARRRPIESFTDLIAPSQVH